MNLLESKMRCNIILATLSLQLQFTVLNLEHTYLNTCPYVSTTKSQLSDEGSNDDIGPIKQFIIQVLLYILQRLNIATAAAVLICHSYI